MESHFPDVNPGILVVKSTGPVARARLIIGSQCAAKPEQEPGNAEAFPAKASSEV
jgi:hypothetical protein